MARRGIAILAATEAHARELAPRMRDEDALEVLALAGQEPLEALLTSLEHSDEAYTLFIEGEAAAMFGTCPLPNSPSRVVWALTSDTVDRYPITFAKASRACVEIMRERNVMLWNFIDRRYETSVRWAKWLGFDVDEAQPDGVDTPVVTITMKGP